MPDMLANAAAWLDDKLEETASQTVEYQRQSDSVTVPAVIGQSVADAVDAGGVQYAYASIDFMIKASRLVLAGQTIEPQRGDKITWAGRTYTVTSEQSGERPYRESGPGRSTWRIHAKYKASE